MAADNGARMRTPVTPFRFKQPGEERLVTFDYTTKLLAGDSIASVVALDPAGLTASGTSIVGATVTVLISGGTDGVSYRVSCRVATAQGETLELDVDMEVVDGAN